MPTVKGSNRLLFIFVLIKLICEKSSDSTSARNKRALVFPASSTLGIFIAIAVPLDLPNRNVFMSYNFEANYILPFQGTDVFPGPIEKIVEFEDETRSVNLATDANSKERKNSSRSKKSITQTLLSRNNAYRILEEKFQARVELFTGKYLKSILIQWTLIVIPSEIIFISVECWFRIKNVKIWFCQCDDYIHPFN